MDISDIICKKELSDEEMSAEIKKRLEAMNPPVDPEESKSDVCEELIEWVMKNEYRRTELVAWFDLSPSQAEHVLDVIQKGRVTAMSKVIMTLSLAQVHRARIAMEMDMANATENVQNAQTVKQETATDDGHKATAKGAPSVVRNVTTPAHGETNDNESLEEYAMRERVEMHKKQYKVHLQSQFDAFVRSQQATTHSLNVVAHLDRVADSIILASPYSPAIETNAYIDSWTG